MDAREFERNLINNAIKLEKQFEADLIRGINCKKCFDCGFVWVDVDGVSAWAYCRCIEGRLKSRCSIWKLPDYEYAMERLYATKSFPLKAFIPSRFESFDNSINKKSRLFKDDLKLSESFWLEFSKK
jgi:hypothetical protein